MRMHGRLLLAPVAAAAALAVAAGPAAAKQVNLTIADTGGTVSVKKGDTISITLAANQTTPYHWVVTARPKPSVARVTRSRYIQGGSNLPGAGGTQRYVIRATGKGRTGFETEYQELNTGQPGSGRSDFAITIKVTT